MALQTALLHLKPEPKAICQTRSPRLTPCLVSMHASTYLQGSHVLSHNALRPYIAATGQDGPTLQPRMRSCQMHFAHSTLSDKAGP